LVEGDFGNDGSIDVVDGYELNGDTIKLTDKEGQMCQGDGLYKIRQTDYYLAFDLIEDNCGGRINTTMGFWTRPDFEDLIAILDKEISNSPTPASYLNRARIYMAIGMPEQAKADFDNYILHDSLNARVFVNRAGTRFPDDMEGVVSDCNKAVSIDPNNKNAYFLRGLARYELGEKEQGCEDFNKAIELGFSVLKIAEQEKCASFWNEE
jgi:tetratricopeptide (TPR) repeat protein